MSELTPDRIAELAAIFSNRIKKHRQELWTWARPNGISCFRIYDRDMPDIPFIVDEYNKHLHVSQIVEPAGDQEAQDAFSEAMADAAARGIGIPRDRVFLKRREQKKGHSQYEKQAEQGFILEVEENQLKFECNLSDYLDTGLFLDHRNTRTMIRAMANGTRFLNLFSYTGSFSVYAAAGGALSTTSVDLSNTYTAWAERNLALNGYSGKLHRCLAADVFGFLQEAVARNEQYDLIVMDPPTFSNSKKMVATLDVQRDHALLINQCLRLLTNGGTLFFSNNLRGFKLDEDAINADWIDDISAKTVPEDFKGKKPHRCYMIRKTRDDVPHIRSDRSSRNSGRGQRPFSRDNRGSPSGAKPAGSGGHRSTKPDFREARPGRPDSFRPGQGRKGPPEKPGQTPKRDKA